MTIVCLSKYFKKYVVGLKIYVEVKYMTKREQLKRW